MVRKVTYSCQFITSLKFPTRTKFSVSISSASGAQLSAVKPGCLASSTNRFISAL